MNKIYCGTCKKECGIDVEDMGVGTYDLGGHTATDEHNVYLSTCCEGDIYAHKCILCKGKGTYTNKSGTHNCEACDGKGLVGLLEQEDLEDMVKGD